MTAPATSRPGTCRTAALRFRGSAYPVLRRISDPRLHLAAVIITLQVLGQVAFEFGVSIAQILIALATARCARVRDRASAASTC